MEEMEEAVVEEQEQRGSLRFEEDLEFVQSLANPRYLNHLALFYMEDEAFIEYLKYLQYWMQPEYARFLIYPNCLSALELICSDVENASKLLKDGMFCEHLLFQQRCAWQEQNAS